MVIESRWLVWIALAVLAAWLVSLLAPVLTPFALAALLAYLGDPLADRLERVGVRGRTLGRTGAVVVVFLGLVLLFTLLMLVVIPLLIDQLQVLQRRIPQYVNWFVTTAIPWAQRTFGLPGDLFDREHIAELLQSSWQALGKGALAVAGSLGAGGQAVLTWLANLVLVPVVTFYLLRDWDDLVARVRGLLPRSVEPRATQLAREMDEVVGAFFRGQLLVMFALGLIYMIGLWLIGIDTAFLIGLGAGLLSIIPYLGTFVGLAAALIAALVQFGDWLHVLLVFVVFGVGQSLEGMVLTPKLVGDRVGLHPVAVIFAVMAGGQLFGFLGLLLALPVAAALMVLLRHVHEGYKASSLYHDAND